MSASGLNPEQKEAIKEKTKGVLKVRARKIGGYRLTGSKSDRIKANPYLLPIVAALAPSLTAGSGRQAAAQYLVTARFIAGIETAAGKLFDEQFMSILGGSFVPGKDEYLKLKKEMTRVSRRRGMTKEEREAEKKRLQHLAEPLVWLAEFDSKLNRDGNDYYISLKLGPWTINDTMAREMASAFGIAVSMGVTPVLGIVYGSGDDLSNKPGIVMAGANGNGLLKVGGDLMEFVSGSESTAADVLTAINDGCREFVNDSVKSPPFIEAIQEVERELTDLYGIREEADIYEVAAAIALGAGKK